MKLRICHLTSVHPWDDIRIFHKESVSLAKHGFLVTLIAIGCKNKNSKGVNIVSAGPKTNSRLKRMIHTAYAVYKKALEVNADVYHFHDPELLPVAWLLKRKGKKIIYDVHEDLPRQIMTKPWIWLPIRNVISTTIELIENIIASRLSGIITATVHIGERFKKINLNTIVINNYPLLHELQNKSEWKSKKNEICYIGGITAIRGITQMVEAIEKCPDIKLHIAGNFFSDALRKEVIKLPGWHSVIEHGYVSRSETVKILETSKAGIVTLWPTPNHINSQPNKMFEYMSAGIPVIASNFPLWEEIIKGNHCGLCVEPLNPNAIAEAIKYLLAHDAEASQMGINGRKAVEEKYNWEAEEKKLVGFYEKLG